LGIAPMAAAANFLLLSMGPGRWGPGDGARGAGRQGGVPMIRGIDHVSVPARDYVAAARFYQTVLGFTLYSEKALGGDPPRRIGYLRPPAGGTVVELVEQVGTGGTGYHYCLEVVDLDAEVARLTAAGLRVVAA